MKNIQIEYKERTVVEGRPGFQWFNKVAYIKAPSIGAAILQLHYTGIIMQPGEAVVLE